MSEVDCARVSIGLISIDALTPGQAVDRICDLAADHPETSLVVTPNMDHLARLRRDERFRDAYSAADLVLPDGWPVAQLIRRAGALAARRVSGSDLVVPVCGAAADRGLTVAFVGGAPRAAAAAARLLRTAYPTLEVAGVYAAPAEQIDNPEGLERLRDELRQHRPDIVLLALGSPKQETLAHTALRDLGVGAIVCVGASLDFLAGAQRRAPESWQRLRLEWLYRALRHPLRLGPRYVKAAPSFLSTLVNGELR